MFWKVFLGLILLTSAAVAQPKFSSKYEKRTAQSLLLSSPSSNPSSNIISYFGFNDLRNELWLGTLGGLNVLQDTLLVFRAVTDFARFNRQGIQSLAVLGDTIWAATSTRRDGQPTGDGLIFSLDGGRTWLERPQPLDRQTDTLEQYGINTLKALPIIVPQQNVIYSMSLRSASPTQPNGSIWVATWSGGTRRSTDNGQSWQRMVLPPDNVSRIAPTDTLRFAFEPRRGTTGELTFLGFSVLAASDGSVWCGTVDGVCRTTQADSLYPAWQKFNRRFSGISGNWIIAIREQRTATDTLIWLASWRADDNAERFGASYTSDNGRTWQIALDNERLYDFAFNGDTVYAVGSNGLFISPNKGRTWINQRHLIDKDNPRQFIGASAEFFGCFVQPLSSGLKRLWVGTADGTAISDNGGASWQILRANKPVPTSDNRTYAYPNPFAPNLDGQVRIRYKLSADATVTIRILDFSMNLVATPVKAASRRSDREEEDIWNGKTDFGGKVANGVYFYMVEAKGQEPIYGKIMVLN
ncbi:MAG: hypothetical protein SNJ55_05265 [Chloroherpetonaceae bacterium]